MVYEVLKDSIFGLFVFVGNKLSIEIFEGKIVLDCGYVLIIENMEINIFGVYVVGDL